jgi:hypothetical protein
MAKKNPNSYAERIRKYLAEYPKAKPRQVAAALGIRVEYVYNFRYAANKAKKTVRKYTTKATLIKQDVAPQPKDDLTPRITHPLMPVFAAALQQVMYGKGERHGGAATNFMDQPWVHYAKLHGRGFLTGQAAKKLEEAASTREGEAYEHELLGAIVYAGMAVLHSRINREGGKQ